MQLKKVKWVLGKIALATSLILVSYSQGNLSLNQNSVEKEKTKAAEQTTEVRVQEAYGRLPLYFIKNEGQVDERVKYYEKASGHATYFTKDGVYMALIHKVENSTKDKPLIEPVSPIAKVGGEGSPAKDSLSSHLVKLSFLNANPDPKIVAERKQEGVVNYFEGSDPSKWQTNIPTYQTVVYKEVYPGIDIKWYGTNRQVEYDIVVKPGADPSQVKMAYEGVEKLDLADNGDLEIVLHRGKIIQKKPVVYQEIDNKRVVLEGKFMIGENTSISKSTGSQWTYSIDVAQYDKEHILILDPVLVYSTYVGFSSADYGYGIAVDGSGNAYVTGFTNSSFPTTVGAYDTTYNGGNFDATVTKLDATGSSLVYSTYLGGSNRDYGLVIAVDGSGNAYVTGYTVSTDFPTTAGAYDTTYNGGSYDGFVTKLDAAGSSLVYSTYLGGSGADYGYGIAVDGSENAYVSGHTGSNNFPTSAGAYDTTYNGGQDVFVTKLDAGGSNLVYSTYLGGSGTDYSFGIAMDGSENTYISGYTNSVDFPTTAGAYDTTHNGGQDVFVTKLNTAGSTLVYSTYLGGASYDVGRGITVDGSENAYVRGDTTSTDFPTTAGAYDTTYNGGSDIFVTKLNAAGAILVYSTYLGGSVSDHSYLGGIAVDGSGNAYVAGNTLSTDFPTTAGAFDTTYNGNQDVFVTKLDAAGSNLVYSTYLGGGSEERGLGIAVNGSRNAYVVGHTYSTFPTTAGAYDTTFGGFSDFFVTKFSSSKNKLVNISTRGFVGTGDEVMIGGFFIGGTSDMTILIRAQGPSLAVSVPGVLGDPTMQLYSGATVIAQSDDWETTDLLCLSPATFCGDDTDISATGLDPCTAGPIGCTQESAILVTLPPGGYTTIVSGVSNTTGIGLVEIFEVSSAGDSTLVNLSTRDYVGTEDEVMIGGLFIGGSTDKTIIIRAIGPTLPVGGTMSNPYLEIYSGATVIATNDDWQTTDPLCLAPAVSCGVAQDIIDAGLAPSDANESAIKITLPAGGYTAIVRGVGGTTGIGLVEVYEVP